MCIHFGQSKFKLYISFVFGYLENFLVFYYWWVADTDFGGKDQCVYLVSPWRLIDVQ
jgi:hypothetical protein